MRVILASASPRRKDLLMQMGCEFEILPAQGEEHSTKEIPGELVVELAEQKAGEIAGRLMSAGGPDEASDCLVLGTDTIVAYQGKVLGKPEDAQAAFEMLSMLSGNTHEVYTGVSLWLNANGVKRQCSFYEKTEVTMYSATEAEIRDYIRTGEPMDKAGAYGIQGRGAKFVRKINGDYNNVVGLPIARIYQELTQLGIAIFGNS